MNMKHFNHSLILAVSILLSGCGIYNRYSRPELEVCTDSLVRQSAAVADTSGIASLSWRELFTDPFLQELISRGLESNTDLEIARLQVEEARATLTNARQSYLPSVSLTAQEGFAGATASWEPDIFANVTNAKRAALASYDRSRFYEQAVRTNLVATIAESYYSLLMLDEQLRISDETLSSWNETIATLEALLKAGKSNDVAVHRAKASRAALEASMETVRKNILETENSLSSLLKSPSRTIARGTLESQSFPDSLCAGLPLQFLSARPDVRASEASLAEAFYATNAARAAFYPDLTLSGKLGWTLNGKGLDISIGDFIASAVASLTAPLFNKGTNVANLKIAQARQEEALLSFEQSLIDAGNEVNNSLAAWQAADSRIGLDLEQIAQLDAAVEKTKLLVLYSSANYLEVLTAWQSLLDARLTLAQDRIGKIQSIISLYHALGGGIE